MSTVYYLYYLEGDKEKCIHIPASTELYALSEAKELVKLLGTDKWMVQRETKETIAKNF